MKILMSTPVPFFRPRGTSFSTYTRCKVLSDLGYEIDLLTYPFGKDVQLKGFRLIRITKPFFINDIGMGPSIKMFVLDILLSIKMFVMGLKNNYRCIHVHEECVFMGVILKKILKIPLIYDMHSSIPEQLTNYGYTKNRIFIMTIKLLERWAVKNSDVIIVICPHLFSIVRSISSNKKVFLIENRPVFEGNGTSVSMVDNLKKELKLSDEKVVLYTGSFGYNQGLEMLLETVPLVRDVENVKYVLVGGDQKRIEQLKSLADKLSIRDYIIFTGTRPTEEMSSFTSLADVLVSPRIKGTNTPLKIYSYLNSGKPIVATDLLTHTQVLNPSVSILVKPNSNDFANAIIYLLNNPKIGKGLGEKGKKLMDEKYSYENFVKVTKEVYNCIEGLK